LQKDKNDHQKIIDALGDFIAILRSFWIDLEERNDLHKEVAARHQAKDHCSKTY
jgi:hypothetical protein